MSDFAKIWTISKTSILIFLRYIAEYSYLSNKRACTLNYFGLFFHPACTYCMPACLTIFQFFSTLHTKYMLIWIDMSFFTQYMSNHQFFSNLTSFWLFLCKGVIRKPIKIHPECLPVRLLGRLFPYTLNFFSQKCHPACLIDILVY